MKTKTAMFDCKHFLFQNVLIQMGLNVISVDGMLIKRVKSYVLRCFSCMKYVFEYHLKYFFKLYRIFKKQLFVVLWFHLFSLMSEGCCSRDRMVVGFTTTCAISADHH